MRSRSIVFVSAGLALAQPSNPPFHAHGETQVTGHVKRTGRLRQRRESKRSACSLEIGV